MFINNAGSGIPDRSSYDRNHESLMIIDQLQLRSNIYCNSNGIPGVPDRFLLHGEWTQACGVHLGGSACGRKLDALAVTVSSKKASTLIKKGWSPLWIDAEPIKGPGCHQSIGGGISMYRDMVKSGAERNGMRTTSTATLRGIENPSCSERMGAVKLIRNLHSHHVRSIWRT